MSEVVDHTSTLQLLEARFGVEVSNLSKWRRETCGDLTAAFDFSKAPNVEVVTVPDQSEHLKEIQAGVNTLEYGKPPSPQVMPTVSE
jgi:phospholipase C